VGGDVAWIQLESEWSPEKFERQEGGRKKTIPDGTYQGGACYMGLRGERFSSEGGSSCQNFLKGRGGFEKVLGGKVDISIKKRKRRENLREKTEDC